MRFPVYTSQYFSHSPVTSSHQRIYKQNALNDIQCLYVVTNDKNIHLVKTTYLTQNLKLTHFMMVTGRCWDIAINF